MLQQRRHSAIANVRQAAQVTFLVGILYLAVGTLRLGSLRQLPVALCHFGLHHWRGADHRPVAGLKYFFGISIDSTHTALETFIELVKHVDESKWREIVMCTVWLVVLLAMKKVSKKYPKLAWMRPLGPITVVVAAIIVVVAGKLDDGDNPLVNVVGNVPQGAARSVQNVCVAHIAHCLSFWLARQATQQIAVAPGPVSSAC